MRRQCFHLEPILSLPNRSLRNGAGHCDSNRIKITGVGAKSSADPGFEFDNYSWNHAANWVTECGGAESFATQPPGIYDDCYIPNVDGDGESGCYPKYPKPNNPSEVIATGQDIAIDDGGKIEWMLDNSSNDPVRLVAQGNFNIGESSNVSIYQDGQLDKLFRRKFTGRRHPTGDTTTAAHVVREHRQLL